MPSYFDQAFEAAAAPLFDQWFGTTVRLRRNRVDSDAFTANWSTQEYQSLGDDLGIYLTVKKRVYRLLKTDCVVGGVQVDPRAGDFIVDGAETLEITPVEGRPAVSEEPGGYRWLARTNRVA